MIPSGDRLTVVFATFDLLGFQVNMYPAYLGVKLAQLLMTWMVRLSVDMWPHH